MNVIPLGDQIIVRRFDDSTEQAGAHIGSRTLPEAADRGVVIAAGTGRPDSDGDHIPAAVKAGDTVVFGRNMGVDLVIGGTAYLIMNRTDIFGIEVVSAPLTPRSDVFVGSRPRASEPAIRKAASYGPHRIVVWSTLEEGRVECRNGSRSKPTKSRLRTSVNSR
jgi:chaperonin GroES